jgi:hypothetical protein
MAGKAGPPTAIERFWSKVDRTGDCWEWTACKLPKGYGRFGVGQRVVLAHRMSYELTHGSIPSGMHVDHTCYNPSCVRPSHLRAVTPKQNTENRAGLNANNTTGVRGVYLRGGRYQARVKHNRVDHLVGFFDTLEEAAAAVRQKRLELFTHSDADRRGAA